MSCNPGGARGVEGCPAPRGLEVENMAKIVLDTDEQDARMRRVYKQVWDLAEKEGFSAKDMLWLCFLLEYDVWDQYTGYLGGQK